MSGPTPAPPPRLTGAILLRGLRVPCIIGIFPHERETPQDVLLDVELDLDIGPAAASEDVHQTVDYDAVSAALTELIQRRRFLLLEALVAEGTALLLDRWPRIDRCALTARKPAALPAAEAVALRLERRRPPAG